MVFYHEYDGILHIYGFYDDLIIIIFLVAGVCVSLPALIWAFHVFYTLRKHGVQISAFIILLIVNDLAELLLSTIIVSYRIDSFVKASATKSLKPFPEEYIYSHLTYIVVLGYGLSLPFNLLITFRISGLYLHQLIALKNILSLTNHPFSTHVFSPLCSTISCIILWLLAFGCQFLRIWLNLLFSFLPGCILAVTCVLTCKASPAPDRIKPGLAVLILSTLTLITSCAAGLVLVFSYISNQIYIYKVLSNISRFLISLRVISDPLLCVLVCKEQLMIHKQQTHTEMNADQRSV